MWKRCEWHTQSPRRKIRRRVDVNILLRIAGQNKLWVSPRLVGVEVLGAWRQCWITIKSNLDLRVFVGKPRKWMRPMVWSVHDWSTLTHNRTVVYRTKNLTKFMVIDTTPALPTTSTFKPLPWQSAPVLSMKKAWKEFLHKLWQEI